MMPKGVPVSVTCVFQAAIAAADRFIRLHPNHPATAYAYYLKGLANFNRSLGFLDRFLQFVDQLTMLVEGNTGDSRAVFELLEPTVSKIDPQKLRISVGFVPDAPVQPPGAVTGLRIAYTLVPATGALLAIWVMRNYDLTETRANEIREALERRRGTEILG